MESGEEILLVLEGSVNVILPLDRVGTPCCASCLDYFAELTVKSPKLALFRHHDKQ